MVHPHEDRPGRPALPPAAARSHLCAAVDDGRLESDAVWAVLSAVDVAPVSQAAPTVSRPVSWKSYDMRRRACRTGKSLWHWSFRSGPLDIISPMSSTRPATGRARAWPSGRCNAGSSRPNRAIWSVRSVEGRRSGRTFMSAKLSGKTCPGQVSAW